MKAFCVVLIGFASLSLIIFSPMERCMYDRALSNDVQHHFEVYLRCPMPQVYTESWTTICVVIQAST